MPGDVIMRMDSTNPSTRRLFIESADEHIQLSDEILNQPDSELMLISHDVFKIDAVNRTLIYRLTGHDDQMKAWTAELVYDEHHAVG